MQTLPTHKKSSAADQRYREALRQIPSPGCGCHTSLLGVANLGVIAGLPPQEIFENIRQSIPAGSRRVTDREIQDAIKKAIADRNGAPYNATRPRAMPIVKDAASALQRIIEMGEIGDEADLWECSPIRLSGQCEDDRILLLEALFAKTDLVWIGERHQGGIMGETIRTASEWIAHFESSGWTAPHIIVNPLTGTSAPKESGEGLTYRGNGNVAAYRYCLVEFDGLTRVEQIKFWASIQLPVVALIDSGGKSLHAWIDVPKLAPITTWEQWSADIKARLCDRLLAPLGVDSACFNPARLSRLPGHYREEKGRYQRLLWLSPEGRPICPRTTCN